MARRLFLVLALLAALGLGFGELGDDIWTVSPYASCADDGNPVLTTPNFALRGSAAYVGFAALPTFVAGLPNTGQKPWSRVVARTMPARTPVPPPQRC